MRMNQDERRFDFHGLGAALKRAREEKGWTQAYVAELVDRDSRTIMNIENKGQYPSFDLFVKLITMFDVSVDQFIHAEEKGWTQAYVAELVDRDSRTIMNIENKGQYPSFDLFVKLITMFDVSVDQFIHADGGARSSSCRKHIDVLLNSMNEKILFFPRLL